MSYIVVLVLDNFLSIDNVSCSIVIITMRKPYQLLAIQRTVHDFNNHGDIYYCLYGDM